MRVTPTSLFDGASEALQEWWGRYLFGGLVAILIYVAIPGTGLLKSLIYLALHLSILGAFAVGMRAHKPTHRKGWYLFGAGHLFYVAADVFWYPVQIGFGLAQPYPGPADYLYVTGYVIILWGLWELIRARSGSHDRGGRVESTIVTLGLSAVSLVFLIGPTFGLSGLSLTARAIAASFPIIDILFLAALMRLAFLPGARLPAYKFLLAAIVSQLIADSYYSAGSLAGIFSFASPFLAGYLLFFILGGTALLHPSMRYLTDPEPNLDGVLTRMRLSFLAVSALLPPLMILLQELRERAGNEVADSYIWLLSILTCVMFLLVVFRMYGLVVDISHHKRMERLKNEFTSIVSHELRTPLTSIRGALGLLAGGATGPLPAKAQRMLEIASSNADRLVRLINDILDVDRMETGNITMKTRPCSADELLVRAGDEMEAMAKDARIKLSVGSPRLTIEADPDRVVQVLTNLISNAIKFSPPESTVSVGARSKDGDVLFFVEDEGQGIPSGELETIFDRFQQLDSSDAREKGGTGLGLAISRNIVGQHGGRIWAESVPAEGSVFRFTLPGGIEESGSPTPLKAPGPTVLVCDPDPAALGVTERTLNLGGYSTILVTSGEEALARASSAELEAVVLDVELPGMTGWETAAALKARPGAERIPIVVQSNAPREVISPESGIVGWLTKPADEASLLKLLDNAVDGRGGTKRVLIVEDDFDLAQVLSTEFVRLGLEAFHAPTSNQAIRLSERVRPNIVILDLKLPGDSGVVVVESLRRNGLFVSTPVIVYTAQDLDEFAKKRLAKSGCEVLIKGRVTPQQLEDRVLELVKPRLPEVPEKDGHVETHIGH